MDEDRQLTKQRCAAMIDAGVYDPESKDGIDFCVNFCPYEYCVVMEHTVPIIQLKIRGRVKLARDLKKHKVSIDDIALILGKDKRTIMRYLKRCS